MARGTNCVAHSHDSLVPIEVHHVWPLGYHGPDIASNKEPLCANAHSDAHYFLELLLRRNGAVDWAVARTYGPKVRELALRGYNQILAYAQSISPSA